MNKWYRKTVPKVIVTILAILSGAALITNLVTAMTVGGSANPAKVWEMTERSYEDSADFNQLVEGYMVRVMNQIRTKKLFETDGTYNPEKLVDVIEYEKSGNISGDNVTGVAYTLEELTSWSEDFNNGEGRIYDGNDIIVCEKPDGSYYYYYLNDFLTLVQDGQLVLEMENSEEQAGGTSDGDVWSEETADNGAENAGEAGTAGTAEELLEGLEKGGYTAPGYYDFRITDAEGQTRYVDCWNFGQSLKEKYSPDGADNLLQVVNERPELNGKLSNIYNYLSNVLRTLYYDMETYQNGGEELEEGNTNFTYLYVNENTKKVAANRSVYQNYADLKKSIESLKAGNSTSQGNVKYMIIYPKLKDFETNMSVSEGTEWGMIRSYGGERRWNSILAVAVDTDFPVPDQFYECNKLYEENMPYLRSSLVMTVISGIVFLIAVTWITLAAGRRENDNELHFTVFDHWKTEIAAAAVIFVWLIGSYIFAIQWSGVRSVSALSDAMTYYTEQYMDYYDMIGYPSMIAEALSLVNVVELFFYGLFTFSCFFAGYVSLVRRIKGKTLWRDSVLRMTAGFCSKMFRERTLVTKTGVLIAGFLILQWLAVASGNTILTALMAAADVAVVYIVLSSAIAKGRMKKGIDEIAGGNMSYQIPVNGLRGMDKDLSEKINDIGDGLNRAVEEGMRNERLKTDLITNVSHDIKTPLTSIINYVDILKRSDIQDAKIRGYLDILETKAQRLKTLTEDVVEASKVSSGNITLEYMDVNLAEMIQQTEGEFAEKFAARSLTMVVNLPEEPAIVHVDGRRMWRVLENIFGNAAKYAMPGTRVYADLRVADGAVSFSLKNVSEQQLNISADELTERFIRGDISRSTEGSGLGLSIAKSLTTMQGGAFELYLDGDLFRVNIRFPVSTREGT